MGKRALLSVSDKSWLPEAAKRLISLGYELLSTGGTQKTLSEAGIPVTPVEDVTKFPECFDGRVKTMHPMVMGGILMRTSMPEHVAQAKELKIDPIDLVIVNLYPFEKTKSDPSKSKADIIEQIDIGGPTLLRSAAKNHERVTVICDPADYDRVLTVIEKDGDTSPELRSELAAKVFLHTAKYDAMITEYLSDGKNSGVMLTGGTELRYGENPHQKGFYFSLSSPRGGRAGDGGWGELYQGKALSYLNILDADAAWSAVCEFTDPTAVFVKHANPSGIASRPTIDDAFQAAYDADRLSAFGVIIALNRPCTATIAQKILDQKIFTEVVVAPEYEKGALEILKQKPNVRVIEQKTRNQKSETNQLTYRSVLGGMLVQTPDMRVITEKDLTVVTKNKPTKEQITDLLFAWKAVKYAKSNAIVLVKDHVTIGIGCGQTSRVDSTWIALKRAGDKAKGCVLASDAFFPFPDAVEEAGKHGIAAIIQPGGSIRDAEVFAKADELGIAMVTTGVRAFRH